MKEQLRTLVQDAVGPRATLVVFVQIVFWICNLHKQQLPVKRTAKRFVRKRLKNFPKVALLKQPVERCSGFSG